MANNWSDDFDDLEDPGAVARMEAAHEQYYQRLADDEAQARNDDDERRKREAKEQEEMWSDSDSDSGPYNRIPRSGRTPHRRYVPNKGDVFPDVFPNDEELYPGKHEEWKAESKPNATYGQEWKMVLVGLGSLAAGVASVLLFSWLFGRRS